MESSNRKSRSVSRKSTTRGKSAAKASASKSANKKRQSSTSRAASKGKSATRKSEVKHQDKKLQSTAKKNQQRDSSAKKSNQRKSVKSEMKDAEASAKKPTRPLQSFLFYSNEQVPLLKQHHGINHKEAMSKAGAQWKELTEEQKAPYEKLHLQDVKRYEKQLKEFEEHGYYTLADGTKSTEIHDTGKKRKSKADSKEEPKSQKKASAVSNKSHNKRSSSKSAHQ